MQSSAAPAANAVLTEVLASIKADFSEADRETAAELARAYLRRLPPASTNTVDGWYAELRGIFEFIRERTEPIKVRVFNPNLETDGYTSVGSVVEVNIDDSPFLLDSVSNEIQAHGLEVVSVLHPVVGVERDAAGTLLSIGNAHSARHKESVEHYELDRRLFEADLPGLEKAIRQALGDVQRAVRDFYPMMDRVNRMVELVRQAVGFFPEAEIGEAIAFLQWLRDQNFVFLGYREYHLVDTEEGRAVQADLGSGLGILSDPDRSSSVTPVPLSSLRPELAARYESGDLLVITKTNRFSTVHRRVKLDYVGVRIIGPTGATVGEARMVGLFTSKAFMEPAGHVPILRRKLADIVSSEDLIEGSHDHKAVIEIFESFSKHDLFTAPVLHLRTDIMGLLALQETHQVRLFIRRDLLERSVSVLVALPRDRFNADLRKRLQDLFTRRFNASSCEYHLELGETDPARIHFTVWVDGPIPEVEFEKLESEVLDITRSWRDRLIEQLGTSIKRSIARSLVDKWADRFPDYYRVSTPLEATAADVLALEALTLDATPFRVGLRNEDAGPENLTRVLLYRSDGKQPLSELVPALEDMGMHVVEEVPTRLQGGDAFFVHDFGVVGGDGQPLDLGGCQIRVEQALTAVWAGEAESDPLNRLVITAGLSHWEVGILRAYRIYWRRLALSFTVGYLNDVINENPGMAADLVRLFRARFDPAEADTDAEPIRASILSRLDAIPSLDHDRILRSFYRLIEASLRTNAFLSGNRVLAIKLRSGDVPDMPAPVPYAEIFVYGPDVEAIHLRGGPVARGGIRWSDRREDYRTEVLGLMKAQMTKNAVIVPTGAKGGFVLRRPPSDPALVGEEVRNRYEEYIRALLDVTDNLVEGEVAHPRDVRIHDAPDPYLVVAADKGTATFSDLANQVAAEYGFWLDDAFASGGSAGYDHKALGITARGAWRSLERHFLELGIDPHQTEFSAIGVGDMSGDVFGNGMLGSDRMKLVAAFDHRHIFIDPDPDPANSYRERRRLFELARSSWADYGREVMSPGGGVWPRSAKQIQLAAEARRAIGVTQSVFVPNELISAILRAPVDLFWNGGIGTYVRASSENNATVGDRTNDPVRIDALQLRSRVVVEGGNLGLTQAARIEYALAGGKINTDFIDNSGGVNCSDREVNLKILLGLAEKRGELERADRDKLVAEAADQVVVRILYDNFQQAQMLSQEERAALRRVGAYEQLMLALEVEGLLDRRLEGLPSSEALAERARSGRGLTRPELSVLLVDAKRSISEALVTAELVDDPHLVADLRRYFPEAVIDRFAHLLDHHPLRREILANILSNDVVNSMGSTFVSRICHRSGATVAEVMRAYRIARDVSGAVARWEALESLLGKLDHALWSELMTGADRVVAALTRRYQVRAAGVGLAATIEADAEGFAEFEAALPTAGPEDWQAAVVAEEDSLVERGVPIDIARRHVLRRRLAHGPDAIELARQHGRKVAEVAEIMFHAGEDVGLGHLEKLAAGFFFTDSWQRWALEALEDDLLELRRRLTERILIEAGDRGPLDAVGHYTGANAGALDRLRAFLDGLAGERPESLAPLMIGVRQLRAILS
ncbi:MAG: NAD-glutamate dehydrogenase [Acidimicrobiia bacterium]